MIPLPHWAGTPEGWRAALQPRGTWYAYPLGPMKMPGEHVRGGERVAVYVCCPECGRALTISSRVHRIDALGTVSPSLVCPHAGCRWHVFVRLEGWSPA